MTDQFLDLIYSEKETVSDCKMHCISAHITTAIVLQNALDIHGYKVQKTVLGNDPLLHLLST